MDGFKLLPAAAEHDRLRLTLIGEFDLAGVKNFREVVTPAIDSGAYREIEFDLERLSFIDSSGLHALADADRAMRARGGTVNLVGATRPVLKVFELTGLDRIFSVVPQSVPAGAAT
jgi:anti-anti-sigma factor